MWDQHPPGALGYGLSTIGKTLVPYQWGGSGYLLCHDEPPKNFLPKLGITGWHGMRYTYPIFMVCQERLNEPTVYAPAPLCVQTRYISYHTRRSQG